MKIQVLGMGCPKCAKLAENAEGAAKSLGLSYELEKITDLGRIGDFGVVMTPALVIDGDVKVVGKVPSVNELKALLK